MPSWNIHTAHVERLLSEHEPADLGIGDANAFLFGNYVPDIYVGHMVPDAAMRVDYRITHVTPGYMVPFPNADRFWDSYLVRFLPETAAGLSLLIGNWAHLATDRMYNGRMRTYCVEHGLTADEGLRVRKQADFSLFGSSLPISSHVKADDALMDAARSFPPYRILADDVHRAIAVADRIVEQNGTRACGGEYQELNAAWMSDTFEACNERLSVWLSAWRRLGGCADGVDAQAIRAEAGLPPATADDPHWME